MALKSPLRKSISGCELDGLGDTLPIGLKDVADYPNLIYELLKIGYSDEDIE